MKNIVLLSFTIVAMLAFTACSYKNESLMLSRYDAQYTGELSKEKKSVFIDSISDIRADKRSIGYVLEDDKRAHELYSTENFSKKYREALGVALTMAGFEDSKQKSEAELVMSIEIKKIEFIYNNKSFDKNLKGNIELEVTIKRGGSTITQSFKQAGSKWIKPSYSAKDIEPFLNEIFSQSVNSVVSRLTRY